MAAGANRPSLLDLVRDRNAVNGASNLKLSLREPGQAASAATAASKTAADATRNLPKGMGKAGLVAAAVATVAVIGGGMYMHHRKKQEAKASQWTDMIEARRSQVAARGTELGG